VYLGPPSTSVPSECLFSVAGDVISDHVSMLRDFGLVSDPSEFTPVNYYQIFKVIFFSDAYELEFGFTLILCKFVFV